MNHARELLEVEATSVWELDDQCDPPVVRLHVATGKTPSTIRVSLGLASNFADVHRFVEFLGEFRDRTTGDLPWAPEPSLAAVRERDAA